MLTYVTIPFRRIIGRLCPMQGKSNFALPYAGNRGPRRCRPYYQLPRARIPGAVRPLRLPPRLGAFWFTVDGSMLKRYTLAMTQRKTALFWLLFVGFWWFTHALGYLIHEYAHSFTAWALGCKANPLALNYGHLTPQNVAFLLDIDENVDYGSIFAAGKSHLASVVAVAGVLLGNGVSYFVAKGLYSLAKQRNRQVLGLFAFLFCLMNVGNFLCYVPVRTFTTHGDMATLEKGLQASPWWVATVLGIPFAIAIWHFFSSLLPDACGFLLPCNRIHRLALLALSSFTVFVFPFGAAGLRGYGEASHWISTLSSCVLFPVVVILCWRRKLEQGTRLVEAAP